MSAFQLACSDRLLAPFEFGSHQAAQQTNDARNLSTAVYAFSPATGHARAIHKITINKIVECSSRHRIQNGANRTMTVIQASIGFPLIDAGR